MLEQEKPAKVDEKPQPARVNGTERIAFTAVVSTTELYIPDERIRFDETISNVGEHYDTKGFFFTCPHDGLYVIFVSINQHEHSHNKGKIRKNDSTLLKLVADDQGDRDSASASLVVRCDVGDELSVEADSEGLYAGASTAPCHFTVYMLHKY